MGLTYKGKEESLAAKTDSSFRDCEDSASTCGYITSLYGNCVAWRSYKQSYVTLSTCRAEHLNMSSARQKIISLDKAVRDVIG